MTFPQFIFSGMFTLGGALSSAIGLWLAKRAARLHFQGIRTSAVVAGYETRGGSPPMHYPQLEFTDPVGRKQHVTMDTGYSEFRYPRGYTVEIVYVPGEPITVEFDRFFDLWLIPLGLLFWGPAAIAIAVYVVVSGAHVNFSIG